MCWILVRHKSFSVLQGVDSMAHYEQALRQVRYRNWRPANLSERRFRLTCSELNGRYTSNEFNLEVSLIYIYILIYQVSLSYFYGLFVLSFNVTLFRLLFVLHRSVFFTTRHLWSTPITWLSSPST